MIAGLSLGRIEWWLERDWIGYAFAASVLLIAAAILIEHHRANSLINTRWLGQHEMLRLILVAAAVRILLSEQTYGSVGLLNAVGMINDQMVTLYLFVLLGSLAGLIFAIKTFQAQSAGWPIVGVTILIAISALLDSEATNLSRPANFYLSQAIIGFSSIVFMAEIVAIGFSRTLLAGERNLVSFVVLFRMSQNLGGLMGTSLLGTIKILRENFHSNRLVQQITLTDPLDAGRIVAGSRSLSGVIGDTMLRGAQKVRPYWPSRSHWKPTYWRTTTSSCLLPCWRFSVPFGVSQFGISSGNAGEVSPVIQVTIISPQVSGYVTAVPVQDFAQVKAGQILATIDQRIYAARVAQAEANLASQIATLANSQQSQHSREAALSGNEAGITSARAQLVKAQAEIRRANVLVANGSIPEREHDQALAALLAAQASFDQAQAARRIGTQDVRSVIVGRGGLEAGVEAARAQLRLAQIDLDNSVIRAPVDGQLSEVSVRNGAYVTAGTQLMFLVPSNFWVIANFKERQTHNMRVGQRASFTVDALDDTKLTGKVESFSPATGSEFAVLRANNATGNFVKVAQRIAVRVRIESGQDLIKRLRPGMSVVIKIHTNE